jgi:hypothetical protein
VSELFAAINSCEYLFLNDIAQPDYHRLRLIVQEGQTSPQITSIEVAGTTISDLRKVESNDRSRIFEVVWNSYVAYSVRNESFTGPDKDEIFTGSQFRLYQKSHFLDYVRRATFATPDYPGPIRHYALVCQDHVIDIISIVEPGICKLR